jgi:phospholipid-translocating ATPase
VRNTEWAIACAVYTGINKQFTNIIVNLFLSKLFQSSTGQDTKLALNSKITKNKMSSSEQFINKYLAFFIILLLAIVTVSYFMKRFYDLHHPEHNSYLRQIFNDYVVSEFLQDYFSFVILFNYLIPISLYVTIEMHKFIGNISIYIGNSPFGLN